MPIKIALRKDSKQSPFRRMLNMLLRSPIADSSILCSGYISSPNKDGYYILDDGLRKSIEVGCKNGKLTMILGMHFQDFKDKYRYFIKNLQSNNINVDAYYASGKNWHAKVAIRIRQGQPIAALIGSSNLTPPAYKLGGKWNYEADVLIWKKSRELTNFFREDEMNLPFGRLELILDPDVQQPSEEEQLEDLYNDVMNRTGLIPFE